MNEAGRAFGAAALSFERVGSLEGPLASVVGFELEFDIHEVDRRDASDGVDGGSDEGGRHGGGWLSVGRAGERSWWDGGEGGRSYVGGEGAVALLKGRVSIRNQGLISFLGE